MRTDHLRRIIIPSAILVLLAVTFLFAGLLVPGVSTAANNDNQSTPREVQVESGNVIVKFGESAYVRANQRVESVVVFGGNATVAGTVTHSIIAFGGDVRVLPTAVVGSAVSPDDATIVSLGGSITVDPGAQVTGTRVDDTNWSNFVDVGVPSPRWWGGFSFLGWLVQTAIFLVLGLVAAALLPKQMQAVGRTMGRRPGASLGWGALAFFIIVPVAAIVLLVSIIGILVLIPAFIVVPLFYFFATVSVAAFIVQRLFKGTERQQNLMLATALGVVATSIIAQIPIGGGLAVLVMILFGVGGAVLALLEWRQSRRALPAPAGGPAGGSGYSQVPPYAPVPPQGPDSYAPAPYGPVSPTVVQPSVAPTIMPAPAGDEAESVGTAVSPAIQQTPVGAVADGLTPTNAESGQAAEQALAPAEQTSAPALTPALAESTLAPAPPAPPLPAAMPGEPIPAAPPVAPAVPIETPVDVTAVTSVPDEARTEVDQRTAEAPFASESEDATRVRQEEETIEPAPDAPHDGNEAGNREESGK